MRGGGGGCSWALGLLLLIGGDLVPVAGALVLVAVGAGGHAAAVPAAHAAVEEASILGARLGAPRLALGVAESCREDTSRLRERERERGFMGILWSVAWGTAIPELTSTRPSTEENTKRSTTRARMGAVGRFIFSLFLDASQQEEDDWERTIE